MQVRSPTVVQAPWHIKGGTAGRIKAAFKIHSGHVHQRVNQISAYALNIMGGRNAVARSISPERAGVQASRRW